MNYFDIRGRIALITGSYRGIGAELARGLAEAGATVILNGRNIHALQETVEQFRDNGLDAYGYPFDITDEEASKEAIDTIENKIGLIDILVNNAGIQKRIPLHEASTDDWRAILNTHLTGAFIISQRVALSMIDRGRGKIINVCSLASLVGRKGIGPYTAAKGGLLMLTKAMCADWATFNIQVNGIAPGYFITDMTRSLAMDQSFNDWVINRTPAGRWGDANELIGTLLFLSSDASNFINGQVIIVDGGILATM